MAYPQNVRKVRRRGIGLMLLVDSAAGLIPAALMQLFVGDAGWHRFWIDLLFSTIYAHSIGTLAFVVARPAAQRLWRLPRVYTALGMLLVFVSVAVVGSVIANVIFVAAGLGPAALFRRELLFGLRISVLSTVVIGSAVTVFEGLSYRLQAAKLELQARQLAAERANKLVSEARLSSLESRVHPHFLFNTLNSISALIREDPKRAERMVERLAALLRYSLDAGRSPLAPLRQELHIVRDYLEIERTRFGDRLRFSVDVPEELQELEVPPMAVQTLVENSIKHAIAVSRPGGEIAVRARRDGTALVIEVSDDGPGFDLRALKEGHGLENLLERLLALFENEARLDIARRDGRMIVALTVPQKRVLV